MPLTEFQQEIAQLLAAQRTPDSYLAGGAALHIKPNSLRYSNDLDYFQDSEERVASAFQADKAALLANEYEVNVSIERSGFVQAVVHGTGTSGNADNSTRVEWAHDTAWRFLPAIKNEVAGYCLHPIDLAINKLLALVGREEPRDFLDTIDTHERILSLGALVWAATAKDPGFTPPLLLSLLRRRGRYRPEDFQRLRLRTQPNLSELKNQWLLALADAQEFLAKLPPEHVGCLFYSLSKKEFLGSFTPGDADIVPHFGRPGGVLPQIV